MDKATLATMLSATGDVPGNALWETAPEIYAQLNADFGPFDLDLTADGERHLHPRWLGPGSPLGYVDALTAPWHEVGTNGYSNPPYGTFVPHMLRKAKAEATLGFSSTLLLPLRITEAFQKYVLNRGAAELLFCDHRLCFYENGSPRINAKTGRPDTAPFDSILVRYLPGIWTRTRVGLWKVPKHIPSKAALKCKESSWIDPPSQS